MKSAAQMYLKHVALDHIWRNQTFITNYICKMIWKPVQFFVTDMSINHPNPVFLRAWFYQEGRIKQKYGDMWEKLLFHFIQTASTETNLRKLREQHSLLVMCLMWNEATYHRNMHMSMFIWRYQLFCLPGNAIKQWSSIRVTKQYKLTWWRIFINTM
jgi:hypothetical protein